MSVFNGTYTIWRRLFAYLSPDVHIEGPIRLVGVAHGDLMPSGLYRTYWHNKKREEEVDRRRRRKVQAEIEEEEDDEEGEAEEVERIRESKRNAQ